MKDQRLIVKVTLAFYYCSEKVQFSEFHLQNSLTFKIHLKFIMNLVRQDFACLLGGPKSSRNFAPISH